MIKHHKNHFKHNLPLGACLFQVKTFSFQSFYFGGTVISVEDVGVASYCLCYWCCYNFNVAYEFLCTQNTLPMKLLIMCVSPTIRIVDSHHMKTGIFMDEQ